MRRYFYGLELMPDSSERLVWNERNANWTDDETKGLKIKRLTYNGKDEYNDWNDYNESTREHLTEQNV